MLRRSALACAIIAALAWWLPVPPATAGGGCHGSATQGTGDTVELVAACFTPNILRIDPGTAVTFVNRDDFVHNVGGILWGHYEDLRPGQRFTASFDRPGIYPFACTYHPGMTGAVVVGNGLGAGSGELVTTGAAAPQGSTLPVEPASGGSPAAGRLLAGALGLAIGAAGSLALRRRTSSAG